MPDFDIKEFSKKIDRLALIISGSGTDNAQPPATEAPAAPPASGPNPIVDLAPVPDAAPAVGHPDAKAKVGTPVAVIAGTAGDSAFVGYGSSIDIPRTSLSKGGKFGETITPQALTFAVRREPVAKRLVMDVAEDVFEKWFAIHQILSGQERPGPMLDGSCQAALETLNARAIFIRAAQYERRYGWAIVVLGFEDQGADLSAPVGSPTKIDHLATYSPRAVSVEAEDEDPKSDRFGLPVMYKINRGKGSAIKVHHTRVLHVATRLDEHPWAGVPVLEPVWDDMTVYRNMRWAAGQVYWRLPGLMVFHFPKNYTKEQMESFFTSLGDPNVRTFIGLPEDKQLEILGAAGKVLPPEQFTTPILRSISMGSAVPKQKLEGTEAGAVTGSEVNQREYYKYVSGQQKIYEAQIVGPLIDKMMEIGQVTPDVDYRVEWASAFQLDVATESAAKLAEAQVATQQLRYMTVDEVRAMHNLKPLAEVTDNKLDGQILLSEVQAQGQGLTLGNLSADKSLTSDVDARRARGPTDLEKSLAGALGTIVRDCTKGLMSKQDGLAKAQVLIKNHYDRVLEASKQQLTGAPGSGKTILTLPPEALARLEARRLQAVADFQKVLDNVDG